MFTSGCCFTASAVNLQNIYQAKQAQIPLAARKHLLQRRPQYGLLTLLACLASPFPPVPLMRSKLARKYRGVQPTTSINNLHCTIVWSILPASSVAPASVRISCFTRYHIFLNFIMSPCLSSSICSILAAVCSQISCRCSTNLPLLPGENTCSIVS